MSHQETVKREQGNEAIPPVTRFCFGIRAECRISKRRIMLKSNMTIDEAKSWRPDSFTKKDYRYFRVVDTNNYG